MLCVCIFRYYRNGLQSFIPLDPPKPLEEVSIYTSHERIVALRKNEFHFGRENDIAFKLIPCRKDEPVCWDESSDPEGPFATSMLSYSK